MKAFTKLLAALLSCAIFSLDAIEATRRDAFIAFQPLKTANGKQHKKLVAGGSELFVSLQTELILTQEPYIQQTIDDEANIQDRLSLATDKNCAQFVNTGTDVLMQLAGLSFGNCVAKIDDHMFATLYPDQDIIARKEYAKASLLSSFKGENIFVDPRAIQRNIEDRLNVPVELEGTGVTGELSVALKSALHNCLTEARALVKTSLQAASLQANSVCDS